MNPRIPYVVVSNLPPHCTEEELSDFLLLKAIENELPAESMMSLMISDGEAVIEFEKEEEACGFEVLNGVIFFNMALKIKVHTNSRRDSSFLDTRIEPMQNLSQGQQKVVTQEKLTLDKWDERSTILFLEKCLEASVNENLHISNWKDDVWKTIAAELSTSSGMRVSIEQCKQKKRSLYQNFREKEKKGDTNWKFYYAVTQLRLFMPSISPQGQHVGNNNCVDEHNVEIAVAANVPARPLGNVNENAAFRWNDDAIGKLIDEYTLRAEKFSDGQTRHAQLWREIAEAIERDLNFQCTPAQCQSKMKDLNDQFKVIYDSEGRSGNGPMQPWRHYDALYALNINRASCRPPVVVSVGTQNVRRRFIPAEDKENATPSRQRLSDRRIRRRIPVAGQSSARSTGSDERTAALVQIAGSVESLLQLYRMRTERQLGREIDRDMM